MPFHSIFYSTQWYQSNQACKPGWVFFACFLFLCLPAKYIFGLTVLKFLGHLVYGFYNSFVIAASAVCNHCLPRAKLAKYAGCLMWVVENIFAHWHMFRWFNLLSTQPSLVYKNPFWQNMSFTCTFSSGKEFNWQLEVYQAHPFWCCDVFHEYTLPRNPSQTFFCNMSNVLQGLSPFYA